MAIVRIGAVALEMSGMDRESARFQALSAFTGTGFTTHETEEVMRHPQRRRIVSTLILLGYAGLVTMSAGLLQTIISSNGSESPRWFVLLNLGGMALALYLLYRFIVWPRLSAQIDRSIRAGLENRFGLEPAHVEELLTATEGWGIVRFEVQGESRFAHHTLAQSRLRDQGVLVLAIERGGRVIPSPGRASVLMPGDVLLAYGRLDQMEKLSQGEAEAEEPPGATGTEGEASWPPPG
jgi:DNA-binding transcriptional ArsR family regulator